MTLIDTSAWVHYLRATGSETHRRVRQLVESDVTVYTTEVVLMEILAGARDEAQVARLRRLLARCEFVAVQGLDDFQQAAALYRRCRRAGETVRALIDCVIAAVAIRADLAVLHADRDFETLARHTELRLDQREV